MPDYTYHLTQQCGKIKQGISKPVLSSDGKHNYSVFVKGDGADCTCPGWKFHRKCKHVESVRAELCQWDLEHGPQEQSLQQNVNCVCPACGGETDLVRVAA